MRRSDGRLRDYGVSAPAFADVRPGPQGVELTRAEREQTPACQPPGRLNGDEGEVGDDRHGQLSGGQVRPEDQLGVPSHPALERRTSMVVGCRNLVEDSATRREEAAIAGPSQPESQIDVFIIRAEEGIESPGAAERLGAIERAATAGPENLLDRLFSPSRRGLPVAALGRPAHPGVGIAGRVEPAPDPIGRAPAAPPTRPSRRRMGPGPPRPNLGSLPYRC